MWWIGGQKCFEQLSVHFFVEHDALQTLCVFKTAATVSRRFPRRKNTQVSLTKPILKLTRHYTNFSPTHLGCITSHLGCTSCWHPRHLWSTARFLLWNAKPLRGAAKLHVVQPAKRHEDTRPFLSHWWRFWKNIGIKLHRRAPRHSQSGWTLIVKGGQASSFAPKCARKGIW